MRSALALARVAAAGCSPSRGWLGDAAVAVPGVGAGDHHCRAGREWGELPSAGDTSYAGAAPLPDGRVRLTWYSGDVAGDDTWLPGMYAATDIWQAVLDPSKLRP